jgi:hypothetical protein
MKSRKHKVKTDATFFKATEPQAGNNQVVNVNITIEEKDDGDTAAKCAGSCFKACFGLAKTAAK